MSNGSRRLSRGDRRRNDRLAQLRAVVTRETAVLAFDLAADKQACALTDQDSRVLARRTVNAKAWHLRKVLEWGLAQAIGGWVLLGRGRLRTDRASVAGARPDRCGTRRQAGLRAAPAGAPGPGERGLHPQQERRDRRHHHRQAGHRAALLSARTSRTRLGPAAAPGRPPGRAGHRRHRRPPAGHRLARVRLAGGAAGGGQAAGLGELAGRDDGGAGPGRHHRRPGGDPPLGLDPVRCSGPPRGPPTRRHPVVLEDRAGSLRCRGRPGPVSSRRGQAARRRARADPVCDVRPGPRPRRGRSRRDSHGAGARPARLDRAWRPASLGCPRSVPPPSSPRPATPLGSPPPVHWSSTPVSAPGTTPQAPTRARLGSAAAAAHSSGWRPGGRCGLRCATTPCSPPDTRT